MIANDLRKTGRLLQNFCTRKTLARKPKPVYELMRLGVADLTRNFVAGSHPQNDTVRKASIFQVFWFFRKAAFEQCLEGAAKHTTTVNELRNLTGLLKHEQTSFCTTLCLLWF
jgi:hypothetical protein